MVARAPTPEPSDEEPKYITVVHPYPLNAHMELPKDQRDFVLWLACCTGKDVLSAFFHKPSSPGMVIVEIDRNFDFKRVLGEHKWSKFLKTPTEEEADRTSRAYYCTLNTGRKVQKNGWKRVEVEEHWFAGWSPNNRFIVYPYPKTSYCELPKENQTNYPLCCQLPKNDFPRPPPALAPPVGSAQWHEAKANGTLPEGKPQPLSKTIGAWGKRAPKIAPRTATRPPPLAVPTPSASIISPVPSSRASTSSVCTYFTPLSSRHSSLVAQGRVGCPH
ncbi:hypothetical protein BV25DRAFT_1826226 [Artomyces pyxidatus]|uniref:Uncharacterized protein n=1 Tax=Artomyces pyxidatus TaxID=48021 RepID=A0ACB8T0C8_9AGAM|nr:hypothetical protein BV25DRAFT_1826226 [Artomyces pyxidatus]